jgi:DNA repair exonuclease SbcCD nuclease subunit
MKKAYVMLFIVISSISYSQTIYETIDWINRNSHGRHKVLFIEKTNRIQLIKVDIIPGVIESARVQEFNPNDVITISAPTKNDDWNDIVFIFKKGGAEVTCFTIIDKNKTRSGESKKIVTGIVADIKSDEKTILSYKKAYLNLFKKTGVNVKDGDFYNAEISTKSNPVLFDKGKPQSSPKTNVTKLNINESLNSYKIHNQELLNENERLKLTIDGLKESIEKLISTSKDMTILSTKGAENIERALESIKEKDLKISRMQDALRKKDSITLELVRALKNKT